MNSPEQERLAAVFRARALRLAQTQAAASPTTPVLVFRVGAERFGLELPVVTEVIAGARCAAVPGAARDLAGVMNLRGAIRPVWKAHRLFGIEAAPATDAAVVVIRRRGQVAGLLVDRVDEIRQVRAEEWAPEPPASPYVRKATTDLLMVIDPEQLFKEASS